MPKFKILIIEGTKRQDRQSIHAAKLVFKVSQTYDEIEPILIDPVDFNFPADGSDKINKDPAYSQLTKEADGFFIVTPEYNHSFPGTLKRMLDSEFKNYLHKPVAFGGVSNGPWGGVRAIEALLMPVRAMGMVMINKDVHFPNINELFDEEGNLLDEKYIPRIKKVLEELIWMAKVMRNGREKK